jgi:hypothetical protein
VDVRDDSYTLVTSLLDVEQGKAIHGAQSTYRGSMARFMALVPESNLMILLGPPRPAIAAAHVPRAATNAPGRPPAHAAAHGPAPAPAMAARSPDKTHGDSAADSRLSRAWDSARTRFQRKTGGARVEPDEPGFEFPWFIHDHLEIGARMTSLSLDTTSGTFIGTINRLEEDDGYAPMAFLTVLVVPYVGIDLTWDEVEAVTRAYSHPTDSDGTVVMDGPILSALVRYPFDVELRGRKRTIAPYAGFGLAFLSTDFEAAPWWHYGSSSSEEYDRWVASGSPQSEGDQYTRTITVTDDRGRVFSLGCSIQIWDGLSVDLHYRTVDASTDAVFVRAYSNGNSETVYGHFPLSHTSYGLGIKYSF